MDLKNETAFLAYIKAAIESDKLKLPTLPDVALSVRQAVNSGKASDAELARLIASDPGLSVKVLQVVNSPLYRARQKIDSLQIAITRIGHNAVRNLVTNLAMKQLFKPGSLILETYFQNIWQHSVNVAAICRALALRCRNLDPDQAMLAGLIHQIGKLPVLTVAEKFPELCEEKGIIERHLERLHPEIGRLIMESWDLPEALSQVPCIYLDFYRDSGSLPDYVDVVQVAYLENLIVRDATNKPDLSRVSAFAKLGLDPEIEVLELEGIAADVEETGQLFG